MLLHCACIYTGFTSTWFLTTFKKLEIRTDTQSEYYAIWHMCLGHNEAFKHFNRSILSEFIKVMY